MKHFLQLIAVLCLSFIMMSGACSSAKKDSEKTDSSAMVDKKTDVKSTKEKVETTGSETSTNEKKGKATLGSATNESNANGKAEMDAKVGDSETAADKNVAANEKQITILLADGKSPDMLTENLKAFGLKHQGRTSRSENRWMFTYDANKISAKALQEILSKSNLVKEVIPVK